MKVLLSKKTGNFYYWLGNGDYHTKEGFVTEEDLNSGNNIVKTNTGKEFLIFNSNNYDRRNKIKRGAQLITPKDLGYIASRTGLDRNCVVVEAGSGSGAATIFFSGIVKFVHTFEIVESHYEIVKKNLNFIGCDNVDIVLGDINENLSNLPDADLLFLDMPEPQNLLEKNLNFLKSGSYIVCYLPSITQIQVLTQLLEKRDDYYLEESTEVILRHWKVWGRVARPMHRKEIDHTAFLVFIRKI